MQFSRIFPFLFLLIAIGDLVGRILNEPWLDHFFKPLIMLSLGGFLVAQTHHVPNGWLKWGTLIAIFFSGLGDVCLMFTGEQFFQLGLASFLTAHLAYLVAFGQPRAAPRTRGLLASRPYLALPFLALGIGLYTFLWPTLGNLWLPVLLYTLVLTAMSLAALNRYGRATSQSFRAVMAGAILFLLSDSCLAISLFGHSFPYAGVLVMLTYIPAQYLIVQGLSWQILARK